MKTVRFFIALLSLFSMAFLHGCSSIKEALDVNGIGESAAAMLASAKRFQGDRFSGPIELAKTVDSFDPFAKLEAAADIFPRIETLDRWKLSPEGSGFHQEKILFPSVSPARAGAPDDAVFCAGKRRFFGYQAMGFQISLSRLSANSSRSNSIVTTPYCSIQSRATSSASMKGKKAETGCFPPIPLSTSRQWRPFWESLKPA
jgi:hypothetical protein